MSLAASFFTAVQNPGIGSAALTVSFNATVDLPAGALPRTLASQARAELSARGHASVDGEGRAGAEARRVRGEQRIDLGDLTRLSGP
jgi:stage V sporulation protein SpoVS